ncbi:unnamed protein product [Eruca vesicaria subsp. sativa]|uniref:NB-ARC domain-containing protein n=1 Tax=Eruca vesicaria subsp. sativa TaxID=29727 RepID=A0ABC8JU20_ERUVS|nr:unnamed protein product [Eruca vesicaria subsp. sativa]
MVIQPVFYEVDLVYHRRRWTDDFIRHRERESFERVNRWRNAFQRLENTTRRFCSRDWEDDSKMLDSLIISISQATLSSQRDFGSGSVVRLQSSIMRDDDISKSFSSLGRDPHVTDNFSSEMPFSCLVGMERHKKAIYGLLDLESKNQVRTVGIWGLEGVGKTTLAECVFKDISRRFQHHCFLTNVNNNHHNRISPSLREYFTKTGCSNDDSFNAIKPSLVNRNVLLVVDGVDEDEQFRDIVKLAHWLGPGSRVIVTSRDGNLLASCGVNYVYKVDCLRYEEALELFSHHAFNETYPLIGFERFSVNAVHFSGRLPLSLKVLGSFLYGKDEKSWKSTLRKLEASQDNCTREISSYIGAYERLPKHQIAELERYVGADDGDY